MVRPQNNNVGGSGGGFPPDDTSHPLYLHPSDNPGAVLVAELLNGSNYLEWSRSMHKVGLIDNTVLRPEANDVTLSSWIRCNSMVVSWLRNAKIPQIRSSLLYLNNAAQIWTDLKTRFSQGDDARVYHLKQKLLNLKQGSQDVNTYYTNLRIIWDEYTKFQPKTWYECGGCRCRSAVKWRDFQQKDFDMHFLMGLNESYVALKTHLMSLDPFPSFGKVFSLVLQEERQRSVFSAGGENSHTPPLSEPVGMMTNASQSSYNKPREELHCTHCGKSNHTIDKCFQLHGFPPGFGRGNSNSGFGRGNHPSVFGRGRGRPNDSSNYMSRSVHNVTSDEVHSESGNAPMSLTVDQCSQLINFLQQQMNVGIGSSSQQPASLNPFPSNQHVPSSTSQSNPSSQHLSDPSMSFSGFFKGEDDWDGS